MSQNTSYTSEKNSYSLSPFNFQSIYIPKRSHSCPLINSKYSLLKINSPKIKNRIFIYESNEKEKALNSSKKTKSNSVLTNTTNSNTINDEKKMNKVYSNLTNIISKFIRDEELISNSSNFIPKNFCQNLSSKLDLPFVIDINKSMMENEKLYYYKKLSENIVKFYNDIMIINDNIFPLKKKLNSIVLKVINQSINTSLKQYNIINLIVYGSQASGLSLPESDIDLLLIYYDSNDSLEKFIADLYNILINSKKFSNVISLPKASSPVIKIEYKINSYSQYNDEISLIHMDISFHNIYPNKNTIYFTPSLLIVKYIQKSVEYLPQSKNVIIVIKKYLKNLGLNNYYTGGLNSFSIFLMVFAFYKYEIKILGNDLVNNFYVGQFLVQFLDFFSKFNFNKYIIDINKDIPFIIKSNFTENQNMKKSDNSNAVILDPFTLNNIACNSFRICEIQDKFDSLKQNLLVNYDKNYKVKNIYNTGYRKKYRYRNYYNNNKKISFEEYENEIDFYNGDIIPNFLEMSIK